MILPTQAIVALYNLDFHICISEHLNLGCCTYIRQSRNSMIGPQDDESIEAHPVKNRRIMRPEIATLLMSDVTQDAQRCLRQ